MKTINVIAKTNARQNQVLEIAPDTYKITTTTKPVEGRANGTILSLLAQYLNLPKSRLILKHGHKQPHKSFILLD